MAKQIVSSLGEIPSDLGVDCCSFEQTVTLDVPSHAIWAKKAQVASSNTNKVKNYLFDKQLIQRLKGAVHALEQVKVASVKTDSQTIKLSYTNDNADIYVVTDVFMQQDNSFTVECMQKIMLAANEVEQIAIDESLAIDSKDSATTTTRNVSDLASQNKDTENESVQSEAILATITEEPSIYIEKPRELHVATTSLPAIAVNQFMLRLNALQQDSIRNQRKEVNSLLAKGQSVACRDLQQEERIFYAQNPKSMKAAPIGDRKATPLPHQDLLIVPKSIDPDLFQRFTRNGFVDFCDSRYAGFPDENSQFLESKPDPDDSTSVLKHKGLSLSEQEILEQLEEDLAKASLEVLPDKTFDNLVIDPSNTALVSSAWAISNDLTLENFSPFYIYGDSGTGKSHLLCAIANQLKLLDPDIKILYTNAEEFIRHYVSSLSYMNNRSFNVKQLYFQSLYKNRQVLIIDDIQGFEKAEKSRNAFFEIIADFLDRPNTLLILASNVAPHELNTKGFHPRLTSCFSAGVCCELNKPSTLTKSAIALQKSISMNVVIPRNVVDHLATAVRSNIREIEGAIKTLNTYMTTKGIIEHQRAISLLGTFSSSSEEQVSFVERVKEQVAKEYEVEPKDLESVSKKKVISTARSMAMALARELIPSISLAEIGKAFKKDHSSVHEAINRIKKRLTVDSDFAQAYQKLISLLSRSVAPA